MEVKTKLSGFVLAGGKSRRMGTDKALLVVQNEPLLGRMKKLIEPFCNQVFISGSNPEYAGFDAPLIPDIFPECGPISGLYSCLKFSTSEWNLIVSVDSPFVTEELFCLLGSHATDCDCVIPKHEWGVEPLIGIYNKKSLPVIEEMIHAGDFKLMNLLARLNTSYLDCNSLIQKHPRMFLNLNRLEDFQSI
jgi:molybdopterin-guanine dinucleotide biosynthesis protein A